MAPGVLYFRCCYARKSPLFSLMARDVTTTGRTWRQARRGDKFGRKSKRARRSYNKLIDGARDLICLLRSDALEPFAFLRRAPPPATALCPNPP